MRDLFTLPEGLPVPQDDGACDHLTGMDIPGLRLPSTTGASIDLRAASATTAVFFFYPRTGTPGSPPPPEWDRIPGARGCTPQSCGFRDAYAGFRERGAALFGVSAQTPDYQKEFVDRTHMPFPFLSDADFALTEALRLPTFVFNSMRLIKRLAVVARRSRIVKVFYPVFPPDRNAADVLAWLEKNPA